MIIIIIIMVSTEVWDEEKTATGKRIVGVEFVVSSSDVKKGVS